MRPCLAGLTATRLGWGMELPMAELLWPLVLQPQGMTWVQQLECLMQAKPPSGQVGLG